MAIYSLSHSAIGRTTHAAGTAGAHARYVTRDSAARDRIIAEHIPTEREAAAKWFDDAEAGLRKNGRVADKLMLALPRELSAEQRMELVRDYAQQITHGSRAPWIAGIHDRGKDAANPHAHLVIHDRDIETGKRVVGLSDMGSE
jgi:hypothetical protein